MGEPTPHYLGVSVWVCVYSVKKKHFLTLVKIATKTLFKTIGLDAKIVAIGQRDQAQLEYKTE